MNKKVLIVEDDISILQLERDYLEANGFAVEATQNGKDGLTLALNNDFDLILLDIMLPGVSGLDICKKVRETSNIPILFVSAKKDDIDKIKGLGLGADDYIIKPFSPSELTARVIAHINRYERLTGINVQPSGIIEIDSLKIDKNARRVFVNSKEITLTNKEFDLLACLAGQPDKIFSKDELFEKIWKYDSMGETSTVTVHVNRVRDKLFAANKNFTGVNTVWGRGYRFNK
ncbi:MAG: response regulator transcription factor [Ruminococcaceae bacterium]|nr:response regulator transcription factor [Oscillospiraceae bacterium]